MLVKTRKEQAAKYCSVATSKNYCLENGNKQTLYGKSSKLYRAENGIIQTLHGFMQFLKQKLRP